MIDLDKAYERGWRIDFYRSEDTAEAHERALKEVRKAILDDLREWADTEAPKLAGNTSAAATLKWLIGAYEKDRLK